MPHTPNPAPDTRLAPLRRLILHADAFPLHLVGEGFNRQVASLFTPTQSA